MLRARCVVRRRAPAQIEHKHPHTGAPVTVAAFGEESGCRLQHPQLPCIAVLANKLQREADAQARYKTFPLEVCR